VARRRLGVVLLVPPPVDLEIDALRLGLGDPGRGRIPPHLTLVPPVNVNDDALDAAMAVVRAAAADVEPLDLILGPPATFLPVNPVLYLSVGGDVDGVVGLRQAVFAPPLSRPVDHPFVPHVTLADGIDTDRAESALVALSSYERAVTAERVDVMEEGPDRVWRSLADVPLGRPAVVGRGGLPVELTVSTAADPAAALLLGGRPFTVTARRDGRLLGVATGEPIGDTAHLHEVAVVAEHRSEGVGARLLAAVESLAAERACTVLVSADHPFLGRHGWRNGRRPMI
jgi:2'-5' RNA ligase